MSLINEFSKITEASRAEYENAAAGEFRADEAVREILRARHAVNDGSKPQENGGVLAFGDNLSFMKYLLDGCDMKGRVKLIYIDPPFFSKANYEASLRMKEESGGSEKQGGEENKIRHLAYKDVWEQGMEEYLTMLTSRLMFMRELLADDGTIWVHLDWHSVHYVKILMDEIFGDTNFINEIIWQYKSGGSSKTHFARKHDNILVYGKTKKYYLKLPKEKSYNRGLKPYRFKGVEEFCDEVGWYTMVNMKDVWSIDMVGRTAKERTGYATQKPEALLNRIIEAGSCEGDIVADFFCGSGTLGAAASKLGRRWICSDSSAVAAAACVKRFLDGESEFTLLTQTDKLNEIHISTGNDENCGDDAQNGERKNPQMTIFPEEKPYTIRI